MESRMADFHHLYGGLMVSLVVSERQMITMTEILDAMAVPQIERTPKLIRAISKKLIEAGFHRCQRRILYTRKVLSGWEK